MCQVYNRQSLNKLRVIEAELHRLRKLVEIYKPVVDVYANAGNWRGRELLTPRGETTIVRDVFLASDHGYTIALAAKDAAAKLD